MNAVFLNFCRLANGWQTMPALCELAQQPDLWKLITLRQQYEGSAHKDTETIILRGPSSPEDIWQNLRAVDYPTQHALPATVDLLLRALRLVRAEEVGRVMVVKLNAGGRVAPHVDQGGYAAHYMRYHLVLSSCPQCWFRCGTEKVNMAPGELWWFNHRLEHEVRNDGADRIHLIIDATAPWATGALLRPSALRFSGE